MNGPQTVYQLPCRRTSRRAAATDVSPADGSGPTPARVELPIRYSSMILLRTLPGAVTVELVRPPFTEGNGVIAVVKNGTTQTIWSGTGRTDCSILTLELRVGRRWVPITGCSAAERRRAVPIGPRRGRGIAIDPQSPDLLQTPAAGGRAVAFGVGTYRMKFSYPPVSLPGGWPRAIYRVLAGVRDRPPSVGTRSERGRIWTPHSGTRVAGHTFATHPAAKRHVGSTGGDCARKGDR